MSIRDEIDKVILEEAKSDERKKRMMGKKTTQMSSKGYRSRFEKPTYFAVLIGKILYKVNRNKPRKPISQRRGIEGYVEQDFYEKPKLTIFTIFKEDLLAFPKRLFQLGMKKHKNPDLPNSKESIDDWKEYFEKDPHDWQGARKNE